MLRDQSALALLAHTLSRPAAPASARTTRTNRRRLPTARSIRAKFNAVPMGTQKLAEQFTISTAPRSRVASTAREQFVGDTFVAPAPKLKRLLDGISKRSVKYVIDTPCTSTIPITTRIFMPKSPGPCRPYYTPRRAFPSARAARSGIEDPDARAHCISTPRPRRLCAADRSPTVQVASNVETLARQPLAPGYCSDITFIFKIQKATGFRGATRLFQRNVSLHRPLYGRQNHRMIAAAKKFSRSPTCNH